LNRRCRDPFEFKRVFPKSIAEVLIEELGDTCHRLLGAIQDALEKAGVEFIDGEGVRLRKE
jgi:hypothetical protein